MKRLVRLLFLPLLAILFLAGCDKKEEKAVTVPKPQPARKESVVVVPESVKGKWRAVRIAVVDKSAGKQTVYTVPIDSSFPLPNTDLILKVGSFLPNFVIEGTVLTSQSNEPINPAVQLRIVEGGKEIYKGWLFALYPTTHAFQHTRYGFTLVDYMPAK